MIRARLTIRRRRIKSGTSDGGGDKPNKWDVPTTSVPSDPDGRQ